MKRGITYFKNGWIKKDVKSLWYTRHDLGTFPLDFELDQENVKQW